MIKRYHDPIYAVIAEHGPQGVNQLAKLVELPVSTVQRYLTVQQTYFKKTIDKKWDLPENVNTDITDNTLLLAANSIDSTVQLIETQLKELLTQFTTVQMPLSTLKRGLEGYRPSVAGSSSKVTNKKLETMLNQVAKLPDFLKDKKKNIGNEYYELLINTRWLDMYLELGNKYVDSAIIAELADLMLGNTDKLGEDVLSTIQEYQIGTKVEPE